MKTKKKSRRGGTRDPDSDEGEEKEADEDSEASDGGDGDNDDDGGGKKGKKGSKKAKTRAEKRKEREAKKKKGKKGGAAGALLPDDADVLEEEMGQDAGPIHNLGVTVHKLERLRSGAVTSKPMVRVESPTIPMTHR